MFSRRIIASLILAGLFLPLGCDSGKPAVTPGPGLAPGEKFDSPKKKTEV